METPGTFEEAEEGAAGSSEAEGSSQRRDEYLEGRRRHFLKELDI